MPSREDLRLSKADAELFYVEDVRTDPPTPLGRIERVYPDGFDLMARWDSAGTGVRFRKHNTPFSSVEGALETFVGPDQ